MVFASPIFLVYFLPLVLVLYYITPRSAKNLFLLLASILFYSWGAPKFIFVILFTTAVDFFLAKWIDTSGNEKKRKYLLALSVTMNVGLLFYFKYCHFFIDNINVLPGFFGLDRIGWLKVALPIGISFYTFESITYLVDVYRRVHKPLNRFWDYQLYILLFPKLIAGPITRYHEIADQVNGRLEAVSVDRRLTGFLTFCIGLAKKVLIANAMATEADAVFDHVHANMPSSVAWLGSLAYTLQIYFDFSGYSDMAIGIGKMLDFEFPVNFNNPYTSSSITEFWRRWHITLGNWMRNYLYIPLGGNRVSAPRLYMNLFIVFVLSGFWHGASWTFIFWGIFHGFFLVIERLFLLKRLSRLPKALSVLITFFIVNLGWVLFRANSLHDAGLLYAGLFSGPYEAIEVSREFMFYGTLAILFSFFALSKTGQSIQAAFYAPRLGMLSTGLLTIVSMLLFTVCLSYITANGFNPFIYFRF